MAQQPTSSKSAADAAQATADAAQAAADAARQEPVIVERTAVHEPFGRPIVYEATRGGKRGGKRKRRYSRGLKDPQRVEEGVTRSLERLTDGAARGVTKYRRRRDDSARRKRDGAIKDGLRNIGRGLETALRRAARAPTELTRPLTLRRVTRLLVPPFPRFIR